jgi:RecA-family ATPase
MADEELMAADAVTSPEAKSEAAAADASKAKSFSTLGRWADTFIGEPPKPMRVLLARSVTRRGSETVVEHDAAWMPAGRLGLLASPGGKGKTAVLMHLAGHVAAGVDWCGLKVVEPGAVVLVVGEEDLHECHRRLHRVWGGMADDARGKAAARTLVLPLAGTGDNRLVSEDPVNRTTAKSARAEELIAYLKAEAPEGGWRLVVVDPFARFAGMNAETDNASATSTMTVLEELTKLPGFPSVLVAHHTKKRGKDDGGADLVELIRGSSAIKDAARWAVLLEAEAPDESGKGRAVLRIVKSNYTSTAYAVELVTQHGIPKEGKVRSVRELDAEADERKAVEAAEAKKGNKTPKSPAKTEAGAKANELRLGVGGV